MAVETARTEKKPAPYRPAPSPSLQADRMTAAVEADNSVRRDAGWSAFGQVANAGSGLVLVIVTARLLELDDFAALNWALSTILYLAAVARVGGMQAGTFLTVSAAPEAKRRVILHLNAAAALAAILVGSVWLAGSMTVEIGGAQRELVGRLGVVVAFSIPVVVVLPILLAALRGLGDFRLTALFGEHLARFAIVVVVGGLALAGRNSGDDVAIALAVAVVAQMLAAAVCLQSIIGSTPRASGASSIVAVLRTSRPFYFIGLTAMIVPQGGVWLLALVGSTNDVAEFGLAARLSFAFTLPFAIGGRVFFPRMVGTMENPSPQLVERLRQFSTVATLGAAALTVALLLARRPFTFLFGVELADAYGPLLILAVGALANTATGLCMAALSGGGHSSLVARASGLAVVGYSLLVLVFGRWWGAAGAAVATAATLASLNGTMWLASKRLLEIDTSARFSRATIGSDLRSLGGLR